jgi:hypothetical protein
MSHRAFIQDWLAAHPGRKMPARTYEELLALNRAWELVRPADLPRPMMLWAMMRFDPFSREYSRIRDVTLAEFMHRVVDPSSPDSDPRLWQDAQEGVRTAIFQVGRHWHRVVLTESHLELRRYLNHLPLETAGNKLGRLKISELAVVLGRRDLFA